MKLQIDVGGEQEGAQGMKKVFQWMALAAPLLLHAGAQASELVLYSHAHFGGPAISLREAEADLTRLDFNDRTASVVVRSGTWELCENANFHGRCKIVEHGEYPELKDFNNTISSVREVARESARDAAPRTSAPPPRPGAIVLYARGRFEGSKIELRNDVRSLSDYEFNDRTASIVINEGRWELCEHADFRGKCVTFGVGRYGFLDDMDKRISSLRRLR